MELFIVVRGAVNSRIPTARVVVAFGRDFVRALTARQAVVRTGKLQRREVVADVTKVRDKLIRREEVSRRSRVGRATVAVVD